MNGPADCCELVGGVPAVEPPNPYAELQEPSRPHHKSEAGEECGEINLPFHRGLFHHLHLVAMVILTAEKENKNEETEPGKGSQWAVGPGKISFNDLVLVILPSLPRSGH